MARALGLLFSGGGGGGGALTVPVEINSAAASQANMLHFTDATTGNAPTDGVICGFPFAGPSFVWDNLETGGGFSWKTDGLFRFNITSASTEIYSPDTVSYLIVANDGLTIRYSNDLLYASANNIAFYRGFTIETTASRPAASAGIRGKTWIVRGGAGVEDAVTFCVKDATDAYVWKTATLI